MIMGDYNCVIVALKNRSDQSRLFHAYPEGKNGGRQMKRRYFTTWGLCIALMLLCACLFATTALAEDSTLDVTIATGAVDGSGVCTGAYYYKVYVAPQDEAAEAFQYAFAPIDAEAPDY